MQNDIEKIVGSIVDAMMPGDLAFQQRFFLEQSLLALARLAHSTGYALGCRVTVSEINKRLDAVEGLEPDEFIKFVFEKNFR